MTHKSKETGMGLAFPGNDNQAALAEARTCGRRVEDQIPQNRQQLSHDGETETFLSENLFDQI
jgi:hypothetical protein